MGCEKYFQKTLKFRGKPPLPEMKLLQALKNFLQQP
jgi:hypothetical protein